LGGDRHIHVLFVLEYLFYSGEIEVRKTPLKRKTGLKPISDKTRDRNQVWKNRCLWRISYLVAKYGYLICEYCGEQGFLGSVNSNNPLAVWGHHIDGERNNTDLSNCYIVHHECHGIITDNNIEVEQEDFQGQTQ